MSESTFPTSDSNRASSSTGAGGDAYTGSASSSAAVARSRSDRSDSVEARSPLVTEFGVTHVDETVVQKLAGMAAREVAGVYSMGNVARRTFNAISERIPGSRTQVSGGVSVEKGEKQAAIDLTVIIEYGAAVVDVAEQMRSNVTRAVEHGTGLEVVEVNITVADVHLPGDDEDQESDKDLS